MKLKKYEQSAKTPELGGDLENLVLVIRPNLPEEQRKRQNSILKFEIDKETGKPFQSLDTDEFFDKSDKLTLSQVIGWENLEDHEGNPVPFSEVERDKILPGLFGMKTGIERDKVEGEEPRFYVLKAYIDHFAISLENFVRD